MSGFAYQGNLYLLISGEIAVIGEVCFIELLDIPCDAFLPPASDQVCTVKQTILIFDYEVAHLFLSIKNEIDLPKHASKVTVTVYKNGFNFFGVLDEIFWYPYLCGIEKAISIAESIDRLLQIP